MATISGLREHIFANAFSIFPSHDPFKSRVEIITRRSKFDDNSDEWRYKAVLIVDYRDAAVSNPSYSIEVALQNLLDLTSAELTKRWVKQMPNIGDMWEESDVGMMNMGMTNGL